MADRCKIPEWFRMDRYDVSRGREIKKSWDDNGGEVISDE